VLWTDQDGQWQGLARRLRELLPHLLVVGDFDPAQRRGPAIWLKCMLARTLEAADWPDDTVPVVYLPGVSRSDLLTWMGRPEETAAAWRGGRWDAFRSRCRAAMQLDLDADGVLVAAERLAARHGDSAPVWESVWDRFVDGWRAFPKVVDRLRQVLLPAHGDLFADLRRYPKANDAGEEKLWAALAGLAGLQRAEAAARLRDLEAEHGPRRQWLWAEMGEAPLAMALAPLRGGLVVIGEINLGGSIEPIHNAVTLVEMAIEKGAQAVLMPVTSRRQLFDLSDDMATRADTQFYQDARDALLKALVE